MNLRQLEALHAVIVGKTVTRAAEILCISQPAVTRLIADLESNVGFSLFERRKGRLYPTAEGLALYEVVDRAFIGVEQIAQAAKEIREHHRGTVNIASAPSLGLGYLPRVIKDFLEIYPGVTFSLHIRSSHMVTQLLMAGQRYDLGVANLHMDDPFMNKELLIRTCLVCVLPPGHRLKDTVVICPADLEDEPFISMGPEHNTRYVVDDTFQSAGVKRKVNIETQLSQAICDFVLAGAGVALCEPITASRFEPLGVIVKPFKPAITLDFTLLYSPNRQPSRVTCKFVSFLQDRIERDFHALRVS